MIAGLCTEKHSRSHTGNTRTPRTSARTCACAYPHHFGSFIQTYASLALVCVRTVESGGGGGMTERRLVGRSRRGVGMGSAGREREGQKGRDSFSTRQPERRMRLRQSSRSLVIYHSPSRSSPLPPPPCPIAFSARLSVSNIEFPLYNSLCPIYRPAYVRNVFLVHPSDASVIIAYDFRGTGDESRESEITGC